MIAPGLTQRAPLRPTPDQRTTIRLLSAPPVLPRVADLRLPAEQSRRQMLLQAHDALHETSVWTRELLTPAPASAPVPESADVRRRLVELRDTSKAQLAEEIDAHGKRLHELREGAAQLAEAIARPKRSGADDLAADVRASKRARGATAPPPAATRGMVVPVAHGQSMAGAREPSIGLVQL